ncbi:helix-turn-helix domain-containing protein, partial [Teichococcus aestuarii]|uniref:helix-turn-helix domain-containing protein n=1 Tax=Teichococcus aestuarii TaxID=568898 RepID=UPI0036200AAC
MPYDLKRSNRSNENPAEALRVGEELREARLSLGISLEEMAERLRINRRYIAALEDGRVADLPGAAYGIGFVRSYAQAMGLDAPDLVRRFREGAGQGPRGKDLVFPEPVPERGVPTGAIILVGAVLAIGAYAGWYRWSGSGERTVDAVPALPPRLEQAARDAGSPPLPGVTQREAPAAPAPVTSPPVTVPPVSAPPAATPPTATPPGAASSGAASSSGAAPAAAGPQQAPRAVAPGGGAAPA